MLASGPRSRRSRRETLGDGRNALEPWDQAGTLVRRLPATDQHPKTPMHPPASWPVNRQSAKNCIFTIRCHLRLPGTPSERSLNRLDAYRTKSAIRIGLKPNATRRRDDGCLIAPESARLHSAGWRPLPATAPPCSDCSVWDREAVASPPPRSANFALRRYYPHGTGILGGDDRERLLGWLLVDVLLT